MRPPALAAPKGDDEFVAAPDPADWPAILAASREARVGGDPWERWRAEARTEALDIARRFHARMAIPAPDAPRSIDIGSGRVFPVAMTGHQPELFHPGVWAKHFAAAWLARRANAVGMHLIADNDLVKRRGVWAPEIRSTHARRTWIPFDTGPGDVPQEEARIESPRVFARFADDFRRATGDSPPDAVVAEFWRETLERDDPAFPPGARFAAARAVIERTWNLRAGLWETPLGEVCETRGFARFALAILSDPSRFALIHNDLLNAHRATRKIRSARHPAPALGRRGDWIETPFWVWRPGEGRRRGLWARRTGSSILELRSGDGPDGEIGSLEGCRAERDLRGECADGALEAFRELAGNGGKGTFRIRTRALTTTMFARLILSDAFLHGIGGAKYDELGDAIADAFFGHAPPPFAALTWTTRIWPEREPARLGDARVLERLRREARDLRFNPDRGLAGRLQETELDEETLSLVLAKREALAWPTDTKAARAKRRERFAACNQALALRLTDRAREVERELAEALADAARGEVESARDFPFLAHSRATLAARLAALEDRLFDSRD